MAVIICDTDRIANSMLVKKLKNLRGFAAEVFESYDDCTEYLQKEKAELVFLGVSADIKGFEDVINTVKQRGYGTIICLTGENEQDSSYAYMYNCDGYIIKPYRDDQLESFIEKYDLLKRRLQRIIIHTFGAFRIFVNDSEVVFNNSKAKELLALCVDRLGNDVSDEQAINKIWSDRGYDEKTKRLYRKAVCDIRRTLSDKGIVHIFRTKKRACSVDFHDIECDLFSFISYPDTSKYRFRGEYMPEYSWAEETLGRLTAIVHAHNIGESVFLYE